jgi:D-threo-aldose 1-dehydrogenase
MTLMNATPAKMQFATRPVGQTGLEITTLGLGGATLAGMMARVPEQQARDTVARALDAGITYYDAAPQYGFGRAEHVVGDALRWRREGTVLSTKVGRLLRPVQNESERRYDHSWVDPFPFDMVYDYSYDGIRRSFEDSLQRLGLGRVDILLVHDIGVQTHGEEENKRLWAQLRDGGYRALSELKAQGVVKAIGIGVNEVPVLLDALEIGDWDAFLVANRYTLLEQTPLETLLPACEKRGTSLIAAGPFAGGILAGTDIWGPPTGAYNRTPPEILEKVRAIDTVCKAHNVPLGAAAVQFALAHPAVSTVLTGPKSPRELDGILAWWNTAIPAALWDDLADKKLFAAGTPLPNGRTA